MAAGLEEYLSPAGVTVIEWAERWFGTVQSPKSKVQSQEHPVSSMQYPTSSIPLRWVQIETLSETERSITYEDIGV